ncbi:GntR family transcriptional regulator [Virgisporangium aurantiacum]|uniref:GntR family transcriptional regulator n=1 Tax=Virgisporangium aurantiacum TaxID=175570 RepID=A0A8J3ZBD1_9ACTN|nr:GntR family transcriptional regulator [Virgisporangium aurantiacum]
MKGIAVDTSPARRPDAADLQYARLRAEILDGTFPPGATLLETVLSERYGVSRTPMREALTRLAQDGLLVRSTRGFQVRRYSPEDILEIYEARIALETTGAALAASRRTDFDLVRLTHLVDERRAATDRSTFGKLNNRWHEALRAAAHNATITDLLERLDSLLTLYPHRTPFPPSADRSAEEHAEILDAIRARDADGAQALMRDHLKHMRDLRIESLLSEPE